MTTSFKSIEQIGAIFVKQLFVTHSLAAVSAFAENNAQIGE